jgi:hypothetical protein
MEPEVQVTGVRIMMFRFILGMMFVKLGCFIIGFRGAKVVTGGEVAEEQARHEVKEGLTES